MSESIFFCIIEVSPPLALQVLKSRPVQTSLTRDPASDALEPAGSPGHVSFQVGIGSSAACYQTFTKQHRKAERLGYCCFLSIKLCSFFG